MVAFALCLLQIVTDVGRGESVFPRPSWPLDIPLVLLPLLGALLTARPHPRVPLEWTTLLIDLAFTASLVSFAFVPTTDISSVTIAISLKLVATSCLIPLSPPMQDRSTVLTLAIYFAALFLGLHPPDDTHQYIGPVLAGVIATVGCRRMDQTFRSLLERGVDLEASRQHLRGALAKESILLSVAQETAGLADVRNTLATLNKATAEATQASFSTTFLIHEEDDSVELASTHCTIGQANPPPGTRMPNWNGSKLQQAMATGRTHTITQGQKQDLVPPRMLEGIRVIAFSPIIGHGKLLGMLTAGRTEGRAEFDERETSILSGIAAHAAVTINNARLYDELTTSEAAYRDLFERANDLIFVADDQGGLHFANQAALRFFDLSAARLGAARWSQFLPPEEVARMFRRTRIARKQAKLHDGAFEVQVESPHGGATLELRARRISPPDQVPKLFQCIARDVTERRRRDEETRALLNRLQESQRLQDEFVANMSHELRTPLNVIIGYADLIADDLAMPINSDARSFLDRIGAASRALHRMVESILEYARLDRGRMMLIPTNFSSGHLLLELEGLCNDVRSSLDVKLELDQEENIDLATDYDRLYSVLSNLMLNALKFTPKGKVSLHVHRAGDHAVFHVQDTGIGIEPGELRSVFEPFRQVDGSDTRTFGGVGLGLAIVRRNVDLLQGTIDVDSTPEHGTTFTVRVPIEMMGARARPSAPSAA